MSAYLPKSSVCMLCTYVVVGLNLQGCPSKVLYNLLGHLQFKEYPKIQRIQEDDFRLESRN